MNKYFQVIIQNTTKFGTNIRPLFEFSSLKEAVLFLQNIQKFMKMRKEYLTLDKMSPFYDEKYDKIIKFYENETWFAKNMMPMFTILHENKYARVAEISQSLDDAWIQEVYRNESL